MSFYTVQNSFAGGEISPSLYGRADLAKYLVALRTCENWIIHPHGGVSRRDGMRYIARTKYADKPCRLVSFQYNTEQSYILEFGDYYVRFFSDGKQVLDENGVPYEVTTPYTGEDVRQLGFTQSADVLFIAHPHYTPKELWRGSDTQWHLDNFVFKKGPFIARDEGHENTRLSFSAPTGTAIVTSDADLFQPGHVGSIWNVTHVVDEIMAKTSGSSAGASTSITVTGLVSDMAPSGFYPHYLQIPKAYAHLFNVGDTFMLGASTRTVFERILQSDGTVLIPFGYLPGALFTNGESVIISLVRPVDETWGMEITAYDYWSLESNGFWYGSVVLERWDDDENRWVIMNTYNSGSSDTIYSVQSAKNYADSGEVSEPTRLRVRALTSFNTWVPSGNAEADRGYFQLSRTSSIHTGYLMITGYTSAQQVTATVQTELYSTQATVNWQEGAWSEYRGYPSAVGFYQERIAFANSPAEPQTFWLSNTGDYYDFSVSIPTEDDDAINATIASRQVNAIRHFVALNDLILMTVGGEWKLSAGNYGGAVTPTNIDIRPQGYRGCDELEPITIGQIILYIQAQGTRVRDLGYTYEYDSYTGNDLTVLAEHLFDEHQIIDWAYQQEPDSVCWVVRDDGLLCSLTYLREHDVIAWGRHPTNGTVESVATIKGKPADEAYFVVNRNGVRCVEMISHAPFANVQGAFYLDSAVTVSNENGITSVSGLDHLEGQTVSALADGNVVNSLSVTGGMVDLSALQTAPKIVHVGHPYISTLETLDLIFQRHDGTQLTRNARVAKVTARVQDTRGLWAGTSNGEMWQNVERTNEALGSPMELATGDVDIRLSSGYDAGRVVLQVKDPLPASILALVFEVGSVA